MSAAFGAYLADQRHDYVTEHRLQRKDGVSLTHLDGTFFYANPAYKQMTDGGKPSWAGWRR